MVSLTLQEQELKVMDWAGIAYLHLGQSVGEEAPPDARRVADVATPVLLSIHVAKVTKTGSNTTIFIWK